MERRGNVSEQSMIARIVGDITEKFEKKSALYNAWKGSSKEAV